MGSCCASGITNKSTPDPGNTRWSMESPTSSGQDCSNGPPDDHPPTPSALPARGKGDGTNHYAGLVADAKPRPSRDRSRSPAQGRASRRTKSAPSTSSGTGTGGSDPPPVDPGAWAHAPMCLGAATPRATEGISWVLTAEGVPLPLSGTPAVLCLLVLVSSERRRVRSPLHREPPCRYRRSRPRS